jgi:hypothetical protein
MYQNTRKNMGENQEKKCTIPPHSLAASTIILVIHQSLADPFFLSESLTRSELPGT